MGLDGERVRSAAGARQGAGGTNGFHLVATLQATDRLGAAKETTYRQGRLCLFGRQPDTGIPLPGELLLCGGRQGRQFARLPLLGTAARTVHRGQSVADMEVGR